jgi:hypothetical protein
MERSMEKIMNEYKFYSKNRNKLLKKYQGKYLVIFNKEVVGSYGNEFIAYKESVKKYKLGTFLIQLCLPEDKIKPQMFQSRVIFNQ